MVSITQRHDLILKRLADSIQYGDVTIDKVIPDAPNENHPDIVVRDGNKALIIDVTCPFENGEAVFQNAASRKVEKYNYLIDFFAGKGIEAKIFGFVVAPLGGWFRGNELVLDEIKMSMRYRTLFRKLCCADAIKSSRNIYIEHLCGIPQ